MTTPKDAEAMADKCADNTHGTRRGHEWWMTRSVFLAGFKAGAESMREIAAKICAEEYTTGIAMERIRSLPVSAI